MANTGYEIMFNFSRYSEKLVGIDISWNKLDDKDKYIYVVLAKYITQSKVKKIDPQDIHSFWLKMMEDNKWRHNEENNVYRKWNCHLMSWKKLPTKEKIIWKLFLSVILGLKELFMEV
jgi:hypothetical protein